MFLIVEVSGRYSIKLFKYFQGINSAIFKHECIEATAEKIIEN